MKEAYLGIDLGTTNTMACYIDDRIEFVRFQNGNGKILPSVVYVDKEGKIHVGSTAKNRGSRDPKNRIKSAKTSMGTAKKLWNLRGKEFSPTDVAVEILKEVRKDAIDEMDLDEDTIINTVITVPAYFEESQIRETRKAGMLAGLNVRRILIEPQCAAVANIEQLGIKNNRVFVVDLGGGTFDITVMDATKKEYKVLAVGGDGRLGGDDFDRLITKYLISIVKDDINIDLSSFEKSGLSDEVYYSTLSTLEDAAVKVKEKLSTSTEQPICINNLIASRPDYVFDIFLTREQLYEICQPLFDRIMNKIQSIFVENKEKFTVASIDTIILAGGSCNIPKIKEDVEKYFGKAPISAARNVGKGEMVAVGAGICANNLDGIIVMPVLAHSFGIEVLDEKTKKPVFSKIVEHNTTCPCSDNEHYHDYKTTVNNQTKVFIKVFEAGVDNEQEKDINKHKYYGGFLFDGLTKAPAGVTKLRVGFNFDENRILTVTAKELNSDKAGVKIKVIKDADEAKRYVDEVQPVDFEILIDGSNSMNHNRKIFHAKDACRRLVTQVVDLNVHSVGIVKFGDYGEEICPIVQDQELLLEKIDSIIADGWTNMAAGIKTAVEKMRFSDNKKLIIIVTDGAPCTTASNSEREKALTRIAVKEAREQGIDIATIGTMEADFKFLNEIANDKMDYSVDNINELTEIFKRAVAEYLSSC